MNPKQAYQEKLRDPRWQKKRLEVLERAEWKCERCERNTEELHVHHLSYAPSGNPWDVEMDELEVLCKGCHMNPVPDNYWWLVDEVRGLLLILHDNAPLCESLNLTMRQYGWGSSRKTYTQTLEQAYQEALHGCEE